MLEGCITNTPPANLDLFLEIKTMCGISLDTIIICAFILFLFVVAMLILCLKLNNIKFRQNVHESRLADTNELLTNVVQGSKRIERDVDAINQRTRAATNRRNNKSISEKRGNNHDKTKAYSKNNNTKRSPSSVRK